MDPTLKTFGNECSFKCHCKNDLQCDSVTGNCLTGCAEHFMGPGCQYSKDQLFLPFLNSHL